MASFQSNDDSSRNTNFSRTTEERFIADMDNEDLPVAEEQEESFNDSNPDDQELILTVNDCDNSSDSPEEDALLPSFFRLNCRNPLVSSVDHFLPPQQLASMMYYHQPRFLHGYPCGPISRQSILEIIDDVIDIVASDGDDDDMDWLS